MFFMSTIRLTVTADLKKEINFLRMMEYPTLTDAEIVKVAVGAQAVRSRKAVKKVVEYDDSDQNLKEMMRHAEYIFSLDENDQYDQPFWNESKLKPIDPKDFE